VVKYKIAISGKANAGKNTVAAMIANNLKFPRSKEKIVAVADPMKSIIKQIFPEAKSEFLYGESKLRSEIIDQKYKDVDGNTLTYRRALLDLGKFGRSYNTNTWLNLLVEEANRSEDINTYIVSDCRFLSEFNYLKGAGFIMIRVLRDNGAKINDVSELEQEQIPDSDFDYIIENNDTLQDLKNDIETLVVEIEFNR
jgi:dephospho-CoA kinase